MKKSSIFLTLGLVGCLFSTQTLLAEDNKNGMKHEHKEMKKMFQSVPMDHATILQDGKAKMFCPTCGMTLPMFYKTNHAAHSHGKTEQYCSIHCLTEEISKNKKDLKDIKVVDVITLKFVDAKSATYVVGSSKKGTMSMVSKYAFADKGEAEKFAKEFGGEITDFDGAYAALLKDFEKDTKMVATKQAEMAKMGEMIYNKSCEKTDMKFSSTADAKAYLMESKACGELSGPKLQAVGIYLGRR